MSPKRFSSGGVELTTSLLKKRQPTESSISVFSQPPRYIKRLCRAVIEGPQAFYKRAEPPVAGSRQGGHTTPHLLAIGMG